MKTKIKKLVRDRIPDLYRQKGTKVDIYTAEHEEYWDRLKEKLLEEVHEFLESEKVEELADILEVIDALCAAKHIDRGDLQAIKDEKFSVRGGFSQKLIATLVNS